MTPVTQAPIPTEDPNVGTRPMTVEELWKELDMANETIRVRTEEAVQYRTKCDGQHQYYQQVLLTIVENLKIMMRTIAILAGKVE